MKEGFHGVCLMLLPDYPKELINRNTDLIGYIIDHKTHKVIKTSVITRDSLSYWFESSRRAFNPINHKFIVASISLVGEIFDSQHGIAIDNLMGGPKGNH